MHRSALLVTFILTALTLSGCFDLAGPTQASLDVSLRGHDEAGVNGYADVVADSQEDGVTYAFAADAGSIVHTDGSRAIWKAPNQPGTFTVRVTATKGSKSVTAAHDVAVEQAPVVVTNWTLLDDLIGGKDARLTIHNESSKTINALRVRIVMWNNFGERVTYFTDYLFQGQASDTLLVPGDFRDYVWNLFWATGVAEIRAWVYEAAFTDGSVWRLDD